MTVPLTITTTKFSSIIDHQTVSLSVYLQLAEGFLAEDSDVCSASFF
jgi:hypothetical protein